jgi:SAM-dependent methyltransferase
MHGFFRFTASGKARKPIAFGKRAYAGPGWISFSHGYIISLMFGLNYLSVVDPLLRPLRRLSPVFAGMQPSESVLDVCCGTGAQAYEYARFGLTAVGIDLDPHMIDMTAHYGAKARDHRLNFYLADAADMPFPGGSFDSASISLALHEKEAPLQDAVISEMRRVVKKGGRLVFIDYNRHMPAMWLTIIHSIEYLAGRRHYTNFRSYLAGGGLAAILQRHNIGAISRVAATAGVIELRLTVNE